MRMKRSEAYRTAAAVRDNWRYLRDNLLHQVHHLQDGKAARADGAQTHFQTHTEFICEVKPIINPRGLSIKRFLLLDNRSS